MYTNDLFNYANSNAVGAAAAGISVLAIFFGFVLGVLVILFWVFSSLGLMNLAKKCGYKYSWFAWLPVLRSYMLVDLAFDKFSSKEQRNPEIKFIMLVSSILVFSKVECATLLSEVLLVLSYNRIYKHLISSESTKYTILSMFFDGLPFFFNKNLVEAVNFNDEKEVKAVVKEEKATPKKVEEKKEEKVEEKNEEKFKPKKTEPKKVFCAECGKELEKNTKFCPDCGSKVE